MNTRGASEQVQDIKTIHIPKRNVVTRRHGNCIMLQAEEGSPGVIVSQTMGKSSEIQ
jgi:hypothetical protein